MSTPSYDLYERMQSRCVEPEKRMVAGKFGYAIHRFPIKGGIAFQDAVLDSIRPTDTPFMQIMRQRKR